MKKRYIRPETTAVTCVTSTFLGASTQTLGFGAPTTSFNASRRKYIDDDEELLEELLDDF